MSDFSKLVKEPIFFERNRVYRIYKGGMPYKNLFNDGYDDGTDNMFPEEWVASKVKAINPKYFGERDGVSKIKGTDVFFDVQSKHGNMFAPLGNNGEDVAFCWRARDCGFKIYCDPSIICGHVGYSVVDDQFFKVFHQND